MPTLLGPGDMKQFALPLGWDAGELLKHQLADGTTFERITNDIVAALRLKYQELSNDPIYGGMIHVTDELGKEYRDGDSTAGMSERTEYTTADPKRGKTIGHMYPLRSYDRSMQWTWDFFRKARQAQIDADLQRALYDVEDNWQKRILTRFFSNAENQLATGGGYDVPFVKGTGSVPFTPPAYMGQTFTSSHSHFDRKTDDSDGRIAALTEGYEHLAEHGINGPLVALVPYADKADYIALPGFVRPDRGFQYVQAASTEALTLARFEEQFFGLFETNLGVVQLHACRRLPTNYLGMYRSYGRNATNNPLAVRYAPDLGAAPLLMRGEKQIKAFPLENVTLIHEFGVGVEERLNGYACRFDASGNYNSPTIN
ncbi:MAG: hypothetical protein MUF38_06395 [Anaerolineae bacterium]|nr:hypothetical protein [Anaerolineae bacterium]